MNNKHYPLPPGTELESDEEVARIQAELKRLSKTPSQKSTKVLEKAYHPTVRPCTPVLTVCDDGDSDGEKIRVRGERFLIGRTEGDLQIPHDEQISSRHLAITRQVVGGKYRWVVTDMQSRNGLFVRVGKAPLSHMNEILVGAGRYRLEIIQQAVADTAAFADINAHIVSDTRAFENNIPVGSETLTEVIHSGVGTRVVLSRNQYWIGRDSDCDICRPNDPFTNGKHAVLNRSPKGTWVVQNNQSVNGIWLRMPQVSIEPGKNCEFMIGEQRFRMRTGAA